MCTPRTASRTAAPQHGKNTAPRYLSAYPLQIFTQPHNKTHNITLINQQHTKLARAQQLDNTITDLTPENAGDLVQRVGVRVRARAVCEPAMTKLLQAAGIATQKTDIVNIPKILSNGTTPNTPTNPENPTNPDDPNGGND